MEKKLKEFIQTLSYSFVLYNSLKILSKHGEQFVSGFLKAPKALHIFFKITLRIKY
jgi:hypothetical protein